VYNDFFIDRVIYYRGKRMLYLWEEIKGDEALSSFFVKNSSLNN
jgi:hypothetical protein